MKYLQATSLGCCCATIQSCSMYALVVPRSSSCLSALTRPIEIHIVIIILAVPQVRLGFPRQEGAQRKQFWILTPRLHLPSPEPTRSPSPLTPCHCYNSEMRYEALPTPVSCQARLPFSKEKEWDSHGHRVALLLCRWFRLQVALEL